MESFKVDDMTFYLNTNSILTEYEIKEVLNIVGLSRYKDLELEIYMYERRSFEHLKVAYKKGGMLQLLTCIIKKILIEENDGYDNYYRNSTYINIFVYKHRRVGKRQVKYKLRKVCGKMENKKEKIEYFTTNFLKFDIISQIILLLELVRVTEHKRINIDSNCVCRWIENQKDERQAILDAIMIMTKDLKQILKAIDCKDIEVSIQGGEDRVTYKIYKQVINKFKSVKK